MTAGLATPFVAAVMRARGYDVREGTPRAVSGGAADSRNVRTGSLFTAFPGENTDGNLYTGDALAAGASSVICTRAPEGEWPEATIVVAPDATRAVGELAQAWRRECGAKVVGITGTVGKTTAKELTAAVLGAHFRTHHSVGNFNSREGLPLALLTLTPDHEVSVLEMGMDSRGEIARLCEIAGPEVGVVLNIGLTHVEKLGSIEAIAEEKLSLPRLLPTSGTAILNIDDPRIAPAVAGLSCNVLTFGKQGRSEGATPDVAWGAYQDEGLAGSSFAVRTASGSAPVHSPLLGEHTVPAALCAIGVAVALGMTMEDAAAAVGASNTEGRAHVLRGRGGATIIDDRYNASPASVAGALATLAHMAPRRLALLGKMAELGDHAEAEHRRIGVLSATTCDVLATFGDLGRVVADAAREAEHPDVRWFATKDEAAQSLAAEMREGDTVLVKGSRSEALESVLPILEGRP